ncbi:hypothetical protein Tco_0707119 [Tanacetum coccineum]|uniref:Uncharacterized protein n=1 Tax=Tanacetum coccineum TaxID=301880 RepID=A0ABQ4Y9B5_9ASTR
MGLINAFYRIALSVAQITLYPRKAPTDRSLTVMDEMAYYVAPVAFGRTWTIMMIVEYRNTFGFGPAVIFLLPVPGSPLAVRKEC